MSRVKDAELVVGIVGRIGVDTKSVVAAIQRELHALHYTSKNVKLTDYLVSKDFDFELVDAPIDKRYEVESMLATQSARGQAVQTSSYRMRSKTSSNIGLQLPKPLIFPRQEPPTL